LDSEPATGIANLITGTNRYKNGDTIKFEGQSRTEVVDVDELEEYVEYEIKEIIDYAEFGYTVKKNKMEKRKILKFRKLILRNTKNFICDVFVNNVYLNMIFNN